MSHYVAALVLAAILMGMTGCSSSSSSSGEPKKLEGSRIPTAAPKNKGNPP
jgi:hypothetical protein